MPGAGTVLCLRAGTYLRLSGVLAAALCHHADAVLLQVGLDLRSGQERDTHSVTDVGGLGCRGGAWRVGQAARNLDKKTPLDNW